MNTESSKSNPIDPKDSPPWMEGCSQIQEHQRNPSSMKLLEPSRTPTEEADPKVYSIYESALPQLREWTRQHLNHLKFLEQVQKFYKEEPMRFSIQKFMERQLRQDYRDYISKKILETDCPLSAKLPSWEEWVAEQDILEDE